MCKRYWIILFIVAVLAPMSDGQGIQRTNPSSTLKNAVLNGWKEVLAIRDPLLARAITARPEFISDATGLRSANVMFATNADWTPKAAQPTPVNSQQPYLWIQVSLWRHDVPGQPSSTTVGLHADGADYNLLVSVVSSDSGLATRIAGTLMGKFTTWRTNQVNSPPISTPSITPGR